jgi:DNA polymerase elongation subunit (family B)
MQGQYFNPIMATLITGSAKLILAMAEKIATDKGYFAYCDTDSIFVKPDVVKDIQKFFKPLNPYSLQVEMFKIEEDDNHKPLDNVTFYGISAKRYCLYDENNGKITIRKYLYHELGHLT